jgi:transposase
MFPSKHGKMAKRKRMDQVKSVICNYQKNQSIKATARELKISKNTVRGYLQRAWKYSSDLSAVLRLDEETLSGIFFGAQGKMDDKRAAVFQGNVDYWLKELRRVGVTRQLLWQEYRLKYPKGFGYSQFCERLRQEIGRKDLTLALDHNPGEVLMVDFAGKKLPIVDRQSGEVEYCEVLVAVLPLSQHSFCIALPSQTLPDFIHGLNQALLFFGALPKVILSDNLKSYVTRPDRYDPKFTQLCEQLGAHYQIDLQATRVAKPKDKASVENAVTQTYRRIYAPLRNEVFHSLEDLNKAVSMKTEEHNGQPYQKKAGSRQSVFEEFELPVMRSLPPDLFEIKKITKAKVQRNYHVFLGEEKNWYSVPYQYVGKRVAVIYTSRRVEVYLDHKRIASHQRLFLGGRTYRHQTIEAHMPKNHKEWKKAQGYTGAYFLEEAARIGPATKWAMQEVLISRNHETHAYTGCKGILYLGKHYSSERLEQAAKRCREAGKATYNMLKRILKLKLDQAEEEPKQLSLGLHENIRGPEHYQ